MCIWYPLEGLEILYLLAISGSTETVTICLLLHLSLHSDFEHDFLIFYSWVFPLKAWTLVILLELDAKLLVKFTNSHHLFLLAPTM